MSRSLTHEQLHPESPIAIKKNLRLEELDEKLFPSLMTGVRWWPFLCLAMNCTTESDHQRVFQATRRLKESLNRNITARVGPETNNSLRPYISMASKIRENIRNDEQISKLFKFLQKKFDGDRSFFTNNQHEEKWKDLFLKANGKPALGYVRAYMDTKKDLGLDPETEEVITHIMSQPSNKYDLVLWQGAFSFALIRCLFGYYDQTEGKASNHSLVMEWKDLLIRILQNPPAEILMGSTSTYRMLLERIEDSESPPPLAGQTKIFKDEGRPVLASLRIPLFHRLYFKPTPRMRAE